MKIGIIGYGFVGKAVHYGFTERVEIDHTHIFDPFINSEDIQKFTDEHVEDEDWTRATSLEDLYFCDYIFVCLPTPTDFQSGKQDITAFTECLEQLNRLNPESLIVIKSTVRPGTTKSLQAAYTNLRIVFNPEFLTEANYLDDFRNQDRIVIGGPTYLTNALASVYKEGWYRADIFEMTTTEAELVKYTANAFLSTKVAFFNEIYQLSLTNGCDYGTIISPVVADERIGSWGSKVPGPDGQLGFGGKCFPKDIVTFIEYFGSVVGTNPEVIEGAWRTCLSVRETKDWEDIKGATTKNLHRQSERQPESSD